MKNQAYFNSIIPSKIPHYFSKKSFIKGNMNLTINSEDFGNGHMNINQVPIILKKHELPTRFPDIKHIQKIKGLIFILI